MTDEPENSATSEGPAGVVAVRKPFGCFLVVLLIAVAFGGIVFMGSWRDRSFKDYAEEQLANEQYRTEDDRRIAQHLAEMLHAQARSTAETDPIEGNKSMFEAATKAEYFVILKRLIDEKMALLENEVAGSAANIEGLWGVDLGQTVIMVINCKADGKYDGGLWMKGDPVNSFSGSWAVADGVITWRSAGVRDEADRVMKLTAEYMVLAKRDDKIAMFRRALANWKRLYETGE